MLLYSDIIMDAQLDDIAEDMGITLHDRHHFHGARARRTKFLLRPGVSDNYRLVRETPYTKSGTRRVWAISWRGHYMFMDAVFALDPNAKIKTALATYNGFVDFLNKAPATGFTNIGSQMYPQNYRDAEASA